MKKFMAMVLLVLTLSVLVSTVAHAENDGIIMPMRVSHRVYR